MLLHVILESRFEQDWEGLVERLQPTRLQNLGLPFLRVNAMIAVQDGQDTPDQINATRSCLQTEADLIDACNGALAVRGHHNIESSWP